MKNEGYNYVNAIKQEISTYIEQYNSSTVVDKITFLRFNNNSKNVEGFHKTITYIVFTSKIEKTYTFSSEIKDGIIAKTSLHSKEGTSKRCQHYKALSNILVRLKLFCENKSIEEIMEDNYVS